MSKFYGYAPFRGTFGHAEEFFSGSFENYWKIIFGFSPKKQTIFTIPNDIYARRS
jgi:hypothetical protein